MLEWLELSAAGVIARETLWGFQILVALHLFGLALSVGTVVWFDLRLLGVSFVRARVSHVYRQLVPWAIGGFLLMFGSGFLLFAGFATTAAGNVYFRVKVAAILLAGVNAGYYHLVTERGIADWDGYARPPRQARLAGQLSIALWTIVVLCGRMMSYTMF